MVFAGERYYDINRIMLRAIGLWPYNKPNIWHTLFFISTFVSFIFFQLTIFITIKHELGDIINVLSYMFPAFGFFMFYICFYLNIKKMKQLLEQIKADWNIAEDSEMKILEEYATKSHLISLFLVSILGLTGVAFVTIEMLPIILDVVAPMNESRSRKIKLDFEMFLDQQQYFYVYLVHEIVVVMYGLCTMFAIGTLFIVFMIHCCATYKIASTLIGSTVSTNAVEISSVRKACEMYRKITRAICIHRRTIWFIRILLNTINKWFIILVGMCVLPLSCNLLRFFIAMIMLKELSEMITCGGAVLYHFGILFIGNFIGQIIIDYSAEIFTAAYNTTWYVAPLPIQKLLLFIMQCSLKANTLIFGGIYIASLEGFTTLITTSISYFTFFYNTN